MDFLCFTLLNCDFRNNSSVILRLGFVLNFCISCCSKSDLSSHKYLRAESQNSVPSCKDWCDSFSLPEGVLSVLAAAPDQPCFTFMHITSDLSSSAAFCADHWSEVLGITERSVRFPRLRYRQGRQTQLA